MTGAAGWDSRQYLKFERERTLPSRDLVGRIDLAAPRRVVDLGCGPGNSTAVLRQRWPDADIVGVDSSAEMLDSARKSYPSIRWVQGDLKEWAPDGPCDLVFSNAALHWVPDHRGVLPRFWSWVAAGGALAFQVPARQSPPPAWLRALNAVCQRAPWRELLRDDEPPSPVLSLGEYYALLAPASRSVDLWETEYYHVFAGPEAIVEWVRGTALRSLLHRLGSDGRREEFLSEYAREVGLSYPRAPDGRVLFPFLRRFVIAYR